MATRKQIDQARETRLWIGQIIVPILTGAVLLAANPDVRNWVGNKVGNIKRKFNKNES